MEFKEDVTSTYGIRLTRKQKRKFRDYALTLSKSLGYDAKVEKSPLGQNVVIGDIEKAGLIIGAHYDTPPAMPRFFMKHFKFWSFIGLPAFISVFTVLAATINPLFNYGAWISCAALITHSLGFTPFPNKVNYNDNSSGVLGVLNLMSKTKDKNKDNVAYVLFDNEEKGLFGSIAFSLKHKGKLKGKKVIILDCIGEGDKFNIYHAGKKTNLTTQLEGYFSDKNIKTKTKRSTLLSMSDHVSFKKLNHACILADYSDKKKSSLQNIHCSKDRVCSEENINLVLETILALPESSYKNNFSIQRKKKTQKINKPLYSNLKKLSTERGHRQEKEREMN